jgi:hypothetical protein
MFWRYLLLLNRRVSHMRENGTWCREGRTDAQAVSEPTGDDGPKKALLLVEEYGEECRKQKFKAWFLTSLPYDMYHSFPCCFLLFCLELGDSKVLRNGIYMTIHHHLPQDYIIILGATMRTSSLTLDVFILLKVFGCMGWMILIMTNQEALMVNNMSCGFQNRQE